MENNENKEGTKDIDRYEKIVEFARKEIAGVRTVYILLAGILGIIIATGLTIGTILIGHSISDIRKSMSDDFQSMKSGVYADVNTFQRQVNNRIDEEFKKDKIQSLIEDKAREYTEKAAQQYITNEVNEMISPFKYEMQNATNEAKAQILKLNSLYHVLYIASHAKSGSKSAFLDLSQYAAKEGTEEAIITTDNIIEIRRDLSQYRNVVYQSDFARTDIYRKTNDGNNVSIQNDPIDVLARCLIVSPDNERHVLMEYISKKPKEEIYKTALTVFESDSLPACAIFCGILTEISEENPKPDFLNFGAWTEICKKHVSKQ
jgi:hypothetical protein